MGRSGEYMSHMLPSISTESKVGSIVVSKIKLLKETCKCTKTQGKKCKNPALRDMYNSRFKDLKNKYKAEILKAKQDFWKEFCTEHAKSSPWKIYKMSKAGFVRNPVPTTLTLADNIGKGDGKRTPPQILTR